MKEKVLIFIAGLLVGAILTTGVFMIINKNNPSSNNNILNGRSGPTMTGEPPSDADLEAAQKTIQEDGSVRYDLPNGGVLVQKGDSSGASSGPVTSIGQ